MRNSFGSNKNSNKKSSSKSNAKGNAFNGDKKPSFKKDFNKPFQTKKVTSVEPNELRLNRYIANSGVCSRRDADIYIQSGNVKVNGEVITEMGYKVKRSDIVDFDGTTITPEKKVYILLNKPKNFSTERNDGGATNVLNLIKSATTTKVEPVGRMDKTTTGLLLFTNDKDLTIKFTSPNQRSSKLYQISLDKNLKFEDLEKIQNGLHIDGHKIFVEEITYIDNMPKTEIGVKMKSANIKILRHIFEQLRYNVIKLDRVTFAGLTKKNIPRGNYRFLTDQEIINLKNI